MKRAKLSVPVFALAVAAIVAIVVAVSGGSTKTQAAVPAGSAISLKQTALGKTLADANGRTLYLFAADKSNVSTLSAAGRAVWPPFTASVTPKATGGVATSQIGTITATGQVTYAGHPLYYYVGDHNPGQVKGQALNEFGARWYALSGQGTAITTAQPAAPAAAPASSGGGSNYGY
jgi:predicted lipoprotein with Yx(FWY)xxD motif